jgi:hypothetical protein
MAVPQEALRGPMGAPFDGFQIRFWQVGGRAAKRAFPIVAQEQDGTPQVFCVVFNKQDKIC